MHFAIHHIIPALQPYVKDICSIWHDAGEQVPLRRVLPDTCVELFINYGGDKLAAIDGRSSFSSSGSFITSRMNYYMDVQMMAGTGCIAVCFHPGAAHHFFKVQMSELVNATVSLEQLWKGLASEIEERVARCTTGIERVQVVQQWLLNILMKNYAGEQNEFEYSLWQINLLKGQLKIAELTKKISISQRQLSRQFNAFTGLSPKEFARISRFVHAIPVLKQVSQDGLTQAAYESGYYDQAHFIHDCKEFTGLTPGELIAAPNIVW